MSTDPTIRDTPGRLPFAGLTVLVTGNITGLSRDEAKDAIAALGGTPAAGVTKKVDLVVLGEGAGLSKTAKARSLDLDVLPGEVFSALSADPTGWDGTRVGLSFAEWDALTPDDPETEPAAKSDPAHWVGKAVVHVPVNGEIQRQVRLWCACGHKWMRAALWGDDKCPRPAQPTRTGPWETPTG